MPKIMCAMCNELVEVSQRHADELSAGRKKRNRSKLDDVYCPKHTKTALVRYNS